MVKKCIVDLKDSTLVNKKLNRYACYEPHAYAAFVPFSSALSHL